MMLLKSVKSVVPTLFTPISREPLRALGIHRFYERYRPDFSDLAKPTDEESLQSGLRAAECQRIHRKH